MSSGPTRPLSAYVALVRSVRASFELWKVSAVVAAVGRHERARRDNQAPGGANRVTFFEPEDGNRGSLTRGHRSAGANPRVLFERERPFTISMWAVDASDPRNEELQIDAVDALHDVVHQAMCRATYPDGKTAIGVIVVGALKEPSPRNTESYFGKELLLDCVVKEAVFDRAHDIAFASPVLTERSV